MLNLRAYVDVMDRSTPSSHRTGDSAGPSVFSRGRRVEDVAAWM